MSDERGRRRDTPTGIGPGKGGAGQAPRGAGLSGDLPSGSRFAKDKHDTPTGLSPVSVKHEPPARSKGTPPMAYPAADLRSTEAGPWDSAATPSRPVSVEPRAMRSPPPPRPPAARSVADGFAITHQAEVHVPPHPTSRAPQAAHPGSRPLETHKPSLRLKLDAADPDYEGRAVRVPKRRAPLVLGLLLLLGMLAGGGLLWIDAHGGVDNFVAQLRHLADPSAPAPVSATIQQPPAAAETQPTAAAPTPPPTAAPTREPQAAAAPTAQAAAPTGQPAEANPQVATGEVDEPPPAQTPTPQPAAAAPKAPARPAPAARPSVPREPVVRRPPVRREPVIRIQPLGDVLTASPPDPSGREILPPPDPPAPE